MENEEIKFKKFNEALEIEKYYGDDCSNTYTFIENDIKLNVKFNFNLSLDANIIVGHVVGLCIKVQDVRAESINARNITARKIIADNINVSNDVYASDRIVADNINAKNIFAREIVADNITADDISYYSYCISKYSLKCNSIEGRDKTAFLKCIVGEIKIKENN